MYPPMTDETRKYVIMDTINSSRVSNRSSIAAIGQIIREVRMPKGTIETSAQNAEKTKGSGLFDVHKSHQRWPSISRRHRPDGIYTTLYAGN